MLRLAVRLRGVSLVCRFCSAKPAEPAAAAEQKNDQGMNLQLFYRNLLRNTRVRLTNGMGRFDVSHMNSMIKLTRSSEDAKLLLEAYYNLLGNFTKLNNTTTDRMILRYLNVGGDPTSILQLFEHHTFLMYFPQYNVTARLLEAVKDSPEQLEQLFKMLRSRVFIKLDAAFVAAALDIAKDSAELTTSVLQLAARKGDLLQKNPQYVLKAAASNLLPYNDQTKELFELARDAFDSNVPSDHASAVEYALLLLQMEQASESMIRISKLERLEDDTVRPYWSALLAHLARLQEEGRTDDLAKLHDEYTVLLSTKQLGGETANIHQQILSLKGDSSKASGDDAGNP